MKTDYVTKTIAVYDTIAERYADALENVAPVKERDDFMKLVKPGGNILDVGCAAGRDSFYFAGKGFSVTGIDLSAKLLKIAKTRAPHLDFRRMDMRVLKFPPNSFTGIWANAALLHLKRSEVPEVLRQFHRILMPDGILFILVKKGDGEADVIDDFSRGLTRHFTYFQTEELKEFLIRAGFKVEKIYTWKENTRWFDGGDVDLISSFSRKK